MHKINEETQNKEELTQENFATEIFRTFKAHSKMVIIGLLILLTVSSVVWAVAYYQNDEKWRDLFSSYDYISQDGEGLNNINSGTQGDVNNIPSAE